MDRGLIMSHYIIWIFMYIYIYIYIHIYKLISNTSWAEGRPCIFYVCVREIRMTTRSLCLPCFSWAEYDACRFSWAEDDLWSELYMESQCRMIVFIRFAILHLFIYASLYPPASVLSGWGRLTCVSVSRDHRVCKSLQSIWNGCPGGGERGGVYKGQKFGFRVLWGMRICFFH